MTKKFKVKLTPKSDPSPAVVNVDRQKIRREENEEYLKNSNVKAFLQTIGWAEGGNYHARFGYGWAKGEWTFTDESTHPGPGADKKTTAAGMYQITVSNWRENGIKKMGLSDFSPHTQDLIAVEGLRQSHAIESVKSGDIGTAISKAAMVWNSLPMGKGKKNRVTGQHYQAYESVIAKFKEFGGIVKKE